MDLCIVQIDPESVCPGLDFWSPRFYAYLWNSKALSTLWTGNPISFTVWWKKTSFFIWLLNLSETKEKCVEDQKSRSGHTDSGVIFILPSLSTIPCFPSNISFFTSVIQTTPSLFENVFSLFSDIYTSKNKL